MSFRFANTVLTETLVSVAFVLLRYLAMTQMEVNALAEAWIQYWLLPKGAPEREDYAWAADLYELEYNDPEALWSLILIIHSKDQSVPIQQVLSAGPIEDLLAKHGDVFVARLEAEAKRDPSFAKVLGAFGKIG